MKKILKQIKDHVSVIASILLYEIKRIGNKITAFKDSFFIKKSKVWGFSVGKKFNSGNVYSYVHVGSIIIKKYRHK